MELKTQIMLVAFVVLTVVNVYANVYFSRRESTEFYDYIWHGYMAIWYPIGLYTLQIMMILTQMSSAQLNIDGFEFDYVVNNGGVPLLLFNMLAPLYVRYLIYRHRMDKAAQSVEPEA